MNFFKSLLAALLALFIFFGIGFFLILGIVGSLASEKEVVVKDNSVLHLKLNAQITELQQENPFAGLPVFGGGTATVGLLPLKQAIAHAQNDSKIKGIYLDVSYPMAGFSSLEEIRQSLIEFRQSGKWIVAYSDVMSEGAYYLATAADKIYLNPEGDVEFNGLAIEVTFFKRLLDKLEIKPQVFRVGEFKSAVEPFLLEKMSPESKLQLNELISSIYSYMLSRISEEREVSIERLTELADNMMVRNAALAVEYGLVDSLLYTDEFNTILQQKVGVDKFSDVNFITYGKYRKTVTTSSKSKNEIAVIVAEGTIMPGTNEQQDQVIGADTFVDEITKAGQNEKIKAIIIRVNSPGGEFRSSDKMWRAIELAKKKKPVIASMSDYAASGGYYLSMGCDTIVAQPHTITGSIGIFGMMPDMSGFFGNKLGITFDEVKTGQFGEMYTVSRPLTEAEKNFWQKNLNQHYETFTGKAADGRHVSKDEIKKVASGRVWTGAQAQERKLVDVLGGFNDAVKIAAAKANIEDDYKVRFYPKTKPFIEQLINQMEENAKADVLRAELGEFYPYYQQFQKIKMYQGAQARLPFELQLH